MTDSIFPDTTPKLVILPSQGLISAEESIDLLPGFSFLVKNEFREGYEDRGWSIDEVSTEKSQEYPL